MKRTGSREPVSNAGLVVGIGLGLLLVALSLPRVVASASVAVVSGDVRMAFKSGATLSEPKLTQAIDHYALALSWQPQSGMLRHGYASLLMQQKNFKERKEPEFRSAADRIESELMSAARAAPGRPLIWADLARVESYWALPSGDYENMLRLSSLLGPYEVSNVIRRLEVMAPIWTELPDDLQAVTRRDARMLWEFPVLRRYLVSIYLAQNFQGRTMIRTLAFSDSREVRRFDRYLVERLRRKNS
ncbi:MAG: hypothetical protein Q7T44_04140 [Parvibaculum sp.]|nr:hypothetical protein [Parvibaculum sp.]